MEGSSIIHGSLLSVLKEEKPMVKMGFQDVVEGKWQSGLLEMQKDKTH
jgi:hypothetical protein